MLYVSQAECEPRDPSCVGALVAQHSFLQCHAVDEWNAAACVVSNLSCIKTHPVLQTRDGSSMRCRMLALAPVLCLSELFLMSHHPKFIYSSPCRWMPTKHSQDSTSACSDRSWNFSWLLARKKRHPTSFALRSYRPPSPMHTRPKS